MSPGAAEHRDKMIGQMLTERWPALHFWWSGLRQLTAEGKPAPLRSTPFTSLEEARAHHEHEYIQCLECGKMYSQLSGHLAMIHEMTTLAYSQKWQIMKQIPLAGLGCRKKHSDSITEKIASGDVDPLALAALMQETNRLHPKKKPFKTQNELETSGQRMLERQPWHISPAIKIADEETKRKAVERVNSRGADETIKSVAKELGVWPGTLYAWRKQFANFTDLNKQLQELYCTRDPSAYKKCLIQPAGQIDLNLITREKSNLERIVATLGLKEMTQGTLIRKLCTYTTTNPTRQSIFEYDRLVRSIYTLKYLRDPQLERNIRRSQNRIESYHQLRAAVAKVGGKKELTGKNDIETEISNQCGRLISNAIIYYNSAILSRLLERLGAEGNDKGIEALNRIFPVAWQHILLNGHYTFQSSNEIIDLDVLVAVLKLI